MLLRVSCGFPLVGPGGNPDIVHGLCILAQNIINDKIFLAIWFWYVFLMVVSGVFLVYRIATITVPSVRSSILSGKVAGPRKYVRQVVTGLLRQSSLGDWFILNQVPLHLIGVDVRD